MKEQQLPCQRGVGPGNYVGAGILGQQYRSIF